MRKKSIFVSAFFSLSLIFIAYESMTYGTGAPTGYTGAPNENTCTSCHFGTPLNSKSSYLNNLELFSNFPGGGYVPDSTYTVTLRYKQNGKTKIGFSSTVLDSNNKLIGSLSAPSSKVQQSSSIVGGSTRHYVTHTSSGTSMSGDSILWNFEWKAPSTKAGTASFYVALNVTNANGQNSGDSIFTKKFTVPVTNLLPVAEASSDTNVYCAGSTIQMYGGGSGSPTAYSWTFPGGNPGSSTAQNPTVTYNFNGKFNALLRVKNVYGWSDPDTFVLTINQRPNASIQGSFPVSICPGDSVLLRANTGTGLTYLWSTGETGSSIFAGKSGMYTVEVTNAQGCSRTSPAVEVKEYTKPTTTISSNAANDSVCAGTTVTFTGSATADTLYLYRNNVPVASAAGNQVDYTVSSTADFNVRIRDVNGCLSDLSSTLTITALDRLAPPRLLCQDATATSLLFAWQDTSGMHTMGYQVSADSGKTWGAPNTSTTEHELTGLQPDKKYQLMVRAIAGSPCNYGDVATQVCQTGSCNSIDLTASYPAAICAGDTVTVTLSGLSGHVYSLSFEGGPAFTDSIFNFIPNVSGSYSLLLTDSANLGCPPEEVLIDVQVDEIGTVALRTEDGNDTYCQDDTIVLIASEMMDTYWFYVNSSLLAMTQDSVHSLTATEGMNTAYVVVQKGVCVDSSAKLQLTVNPLPDVQFGFSRDWKVYTFTPDVNTHSSYLWDFGDGNTSNQVTPTHDYGASEGQTVTVTLTAVTAEGCENSSSQEINLPVFSDVREITGAGIRFYPNPAQSVLYVEFVAGNPDNTVICLIDINGNTVRETISEEGKTTVDLQGIAPGIYMLRVSNGESAVYGRVMVE